MNKKTIVKQNNFRFFKEEIDIDEDIKEGMYEQLIKNMAKDIDIDFAKTPLVDLLTGYKRYKILEDKINKAIEDLKGTLKINRHYIEETKYGKNEWICMDIDHIQELIDMLEEVKENGK